MLQIGGLGYQVPSVLALIRFHAPFNFCFVDRILGRNFQYSGITKAKLQQDRNCAKSLILSFNWLLHGSKWLQDHQVSSLKPTISIQLLTQAMYLRPHFVCSKKVNWHALQGSIYSGEDHQVLLITCCILPFPTPLFDGVSWPWSRLRRFRGFYKPAEFSGHSQVWQNACPGLVRKPCIGSGPRGRRFRIQS